MPDNTMIISVTFAPNTVILSGEMNSVLQTDIRDTYNVMINETGGHTHSGTTGDGPVLSPNSLDLTQDYAEITITDFTNAPHDHSDAANGGAAVAPIHNHSDAANGGGSVDLADASGIAATVPFSFNGSGGDTSIVEEAPGELKLFSSGLIALNLDANLANVIVGSGFDFSLDTTKRLFFDGGTNTFIQQPAAGLLDFQVSNDILFKLNNINPASPRVELSTIPPVQLDMAEIDPPSVDSANSNSLIKGRLTYNHSANTILSSYNVSSVTDQGVGLFSVLWDTNYDSTNEHTESVTPGNLRLFRVSGVGSSFTQVETRLTTGAQNLADDVRVQVLSSGRQG